MYDYVYTVGAKINFMFCFCTTVVPTVRIVFKNGVKFLIWKHSTCMHCFYGFRMG